MLRKIEGEDLVLLQALLSFNEAGATMLRKMSLMPKQRELHLTLQ